MAVLIASTTSADSAEFTLAAGVSATLALAPATVMPPGATAEIQFKTAGGVFVTMGWLTTADPVQVLDASGDFRVNMPATGHALALGVDQS